MKEIVLRPDEATANDLWYNLYQVGEHIAAGATILPQSDETVERRAAVVADIDHQPGRMPIAEAMQAAIDRQNRED